MKYISLLKSRDRSVVLHIKRIKWKKRFSFSCSITLHIVPGNLLLNSNIVMIIFSEGISNLIMFLLIGLDILNLLILAHLPGLQRTKR